MDEIMNSTEEMEFLDESDLVEADAETEPEEQPADQPEAQGDIQEKPADQPETITAKYKDHSWDLPKKEVEAAAQALGMTAQDVVTLLQKGMNYDSLAARKPEKTPDLEVIDFYARANGMNRDQYLQMLRQNQTKLLENQERQRLMAQYPNADPRLLQEMAGLSAWQKEAQAQKMRQDQERARQEEVRKQEQARRAPWERFFRAHPDMDAKKLPSEMLERVAAGEDPTAVWYSLQNAALETELAQLRKQQENQRQVPAGVASDGKQTETDPFLSGFFE